MKAVVAAFNQEKALVGAFSVIVQPVVEPIDRFAALVSSQYSCLQGGAGQGAAARQCRLGLSSPVSWTSSAMTVI